MSKRSSSSLSVPQGPPIVSHALNTVSDLSNISLHEQSSSNQSASASSFSSSSTTSTSSSSTSISTSSTSQPTLPETGGVLEALATELRVFDKLRPLLQRLYNASFYVLLHLFLVLSAIFFVLLLSRLCLVHFLAFDIHFFIIFMTSSNIVLNNTILLL